ncbi:MAG: SMI1/KNR4 family protein [Lachnospiraceae bacterium]|nr:SMI1/KNR4 family protein [Lachnospiraceae bacterium]
MLSDFINNNDVLKTNNLVDSKFLNDAQKLIGIAMGPQLKKYIMEYGFLIYGSVEFNGVNSKQKMESDLITQTLYLHKYFPLTKKFYAIGNRGDGLYCLADSSDGVFEFDLENNILTNVNRSLFDYIFRRFEEEKSL